MHGHGPYHYTTQVHVRMDDLIRSSFEISSLERVPRVLLVIRPPIDSYSSYIPLIFSFYTSFLCIACPFLQWLGLIPFERRRPILVGTTRLRRKSNIIVLMLTNVCSAWGYQFELTDEHITPEKYEPLKYSYDVLGEQVLNRLNEISPPPSELPRNQSRAPEKPQEKTFSEKVEGEKQSPQKPRRDLYAILKEHADADPLLKRFWTEVNTVRQT